MSSVHVSSESTTGSPPVKAGEVRLEVVVVPVSDVDRAKRFYETLGWRLEADLAVDDGYESVSDLADALRRAAEAHGKHEERTGEADPDWPHWYALYTVRERAGEELPT